MRAFFEWKSIDLTTQFFKVKSSTHFFQTVPHDNKFYFRIVEYKKCSGQPSKECVISKAPI